MGNEERTQTCVFIDVSADDFFFFAFLFLFPSVCVFEVWRCIINVSGEPGVPAVYKHSCSWRTRSWTKCGCGTQLISGTCVQSWTKPTRLAAAEARTENLQMELQQARTELVELEQENATPTASARPDFDQMCQLREKLSEARDQAKLANMRDTSSRLAVAELNTKLKNVRAELASERSDQRHGESAAAARPHLRDELNQAKEELKRARAETEQERSRVVTSLEEVSSLRVEMEQLRAQIEQEQRARVSERAECVTQVREAWAAALRAREHAATFTSGVVAAAVDVPVASVSVSPMKQSPSKRRKKKKCFLCSSVDHLAKQCPNDSTARGAAYMAGQSSRLD